MSSVNVAREQISPCTTDVDNGEKLAAYLYTRIFSWTPAKLKIVQIYCYYVHCETTWRKINMKMKKFCFVNKRYVERNLRIRILWWNKNILMNKRPSTVWCSVGTTKYNLLNYNLPQYCRKSFLWHQYIRESSLKIFFRCVKFPTHVLQPKPFS